MLSEIAMRLWLEHLSSKDALYPEFKGFLQSHLLGGKDLESKVFKLMSTCVIGASATAICPEYLWSMFGSSGKTRLQFYGEMLAEAQIVLSPGEPEFGERHWRAL